MARRWSAVLARLDTPTGDGRILVPGGITSRELPLPLLWQPQTDDGHGGSRVVGRIETISFGDDMVTATGSMLDSEEYGAALEQIQAGVIGPSVDLDDVTAEVSEDGSTLHILRGRIAGATLVPIPAFEGVSISLDPMPAVDMPDEELRPLYASAAPTLPPLDWFARPDLDRLTPLTVSDSGRVFGHLAGRDTCHVGLPGCVTPPMGYSSYEHFHVASQQTAEGVTIPVGTLVAGPRHADPQLAFRAAQQHYDDPTAAVARVMVGEDEFGIWAAGWLLPDARPEAVAVFKSSPVSGDWRWIGGRLELIAVCSVNTPGFPIPRARVGFAAQEQRTLIAAGFTPQAGEYVPAETERLVMTNAAGVVVVDERVPKFSTEAALARWAWATRTQAIGKG